MYYADRHCKYEERMIDDVHYYIFSGACIVTGEMFSVKVKGPDLYKYRQGAYIQDAFPYLSVNEREFLISGMSPKGWDQVFKSKELEEQQYARALGEGYDSDDLVHSMNDEDSPIDDSGELGDLLGLGD